MASRTIFKIVDGKGSIRTISAGDFFLGYRKVDLGNNEILLSVFLPWTREFEYVKEFKQAHRRDDDIALVNGGMRVFLEKSNKKWIVADACIVYGGVAPVSLSAVKTNDYLIGKAWNKELLQNSLEILKQDVVISEDAPGGMVEFRKSLTLSFFFKFFLWVSHQMDGQDFFNESVPASYLSAVKSCQHPSIMGSQDYKITKQGTAVGSPEVHMSARLQVTGEAEYTDDTPMPPGGLHAALMLSKKPHARLLSVDDLGARSSPGFAGIFFAKDIPEVCEDGAEIGRVQLPEDDQVWQQASLQHSMKNGFGVGQERLTVASGFEVVDGNCSSTLLSLTPKEYAKAENEGDDVFLCEYEYDVNWHSFKRIAEIDTMKMYCTTYLIGLLNRIPNLLFIGRHLSLEILCLVTQLATLFVLMHRAGKMGGLGSWAKGQMDMGLKQAESGMQQRTNPKALGEKMNGDYIFFSSYPLDLVDKLFHVFVQAMGITFPGWDTLRRLDSGLTGTKLGCGEEVAACTVRVKDQTYFLSYLSQAQLKRLVLPLVVFQRYVCSTVNALSPAVYLHECVWMYGTMGYVVVIDEVRKLARKFDLPNQDRKDSQGICFLGKIKFSEFVGRHIGEKEGIILEAETGDFLGPHRGFWFYTIGQRQGLKLAGGPWYVVEKDVENNVVFVSRNYYSVDKRRRSFHVGSFRWICGSPPRHLNQLKCKVRHGPDFYNCTLQIEVAEDGAEIGRVQLPEDDQGLAAGQFAAFYEERVCVGSGVILESWDDNGFPVCAKACEIAKLEDKSKLGKPVKIKPKPDDCLRNSIMMM
ncbi:hypothetical protein R6Q59_014786 [Mikania micrantha]